MHRSKLFSWVAARPVALLLTVGVLLVGLSACGSSSSTTSKSSSSTNSKSSSSTHSKRSNAKVVKKEAGTLHVDLTVINQSGHTQFVELCGAPGSTCEFDGDLPNGQEESVQGSGRPNGHVTYDDGSKVYFWAENPNLAEPFIHLNPNCDLCFSDTQGASLVEGEVQTRTVSGHDFGLERRGDTDYKEMRLVIKS